jgi:hypothetical protein
MPYRIIPRKGRGVVAFVIIIFSILMAITFFIFGGNPMKELIEIYFSIENAPPGEIINPNGEYVKIINEDCIFEDLIITNPYFKFYGWYYDGIKVSNMEEVKNNTPNGQSSATVVAFWEFLPPADGDVSNIQEFIITRNQDIISDDRVKQILIISYTIAEPLINTLLATERGIIIAIIIIGVIGLRGFIVSRDRFFLRDADYSALIP